LSKIRVPHSLRKIVNEYTVTSNTKK